MGYPKLLVCSDFSTYSDNALKVAGDFAAKMGAEIILLHVAQTSFFIDPFGVETWITDDQRNDLLSTLDDLLKEQARKCGVKAETKVTFDTSISTSILKTIQECSPQMMFVGHKGLTVMEKIFFGSVANKIVTRSSVPVMVVKNNTSINKIGALIDGSDDSSQIINEALNLTQMNKSALAVISLVPAFPGIYSSLSAEYSSSLIHTLKEKLNKTVSEIKGKVQSALKGAEGNIVIQVSYERDLSHHLKEILEDNEIDLAVMRKHNNTKLDQLLLGSVTLRILEQFKGNVLVLH